MIADPGTALYGQTLAQLESRVPAMNSFWLTGRSYPVELSRELDHHRANEECLRLMQTFQSAASYYQVRRHAELPYDMTWEEFRSAYADVENTAKPLWD